MFFGIIYGVVEVIECSVMVLIDYICYVLCKRIFVLLGSFCIFWCERFMVDIVIMSMLFELVVIVFVNGVIYLY